MWGAHDTTALEGLHDAHITDPISIERDRDRLCHLVHTRCAGDREHERRARGRGRGARNGPGGVSAAPDEGPKKRLADECGVKGTDACMREISCDDNHFAMSADLRRWCPGR